MRELRQTFVKLMERRWQFFRAFLFVFFVTLSVLTLAGFVPESGNTGEGVRISEGEGGIVPVGPAPDDPYALPAHVSIPRAGVDIAVSSPQSRDVAVLDAALAKGAVHYPGSGYLSEDANVFLFGHSSYLPVVRNPAYQAFNGIGDLVPGDDIFVDSERVRYAYRVTSVRKATADEALVAFERGERKLTLSTCDSFTSKAGRFVVEAVFSGAYPL